MQSVQTLPDGPPAILYGAKSTDDVHGSIPTQLSDTRTLAERSGWRVEAEYSDEARSAYKGNRGEGLAQARAHAGQLAAEHGACMLVVQHTDRLARGDGVKADHLVELALWARKCGVQLRSVQDPQTCEGGLAFAAMMGDRNHEDSRRKSEAVRSGKRRQFDRGERLGGPVPDGYVKLSRREGEPTVYELCPERGPVLRRLFELAHAGMPPATIARTLNAEGVRTRSGGAWKRRRVQDTLQNGWYAGLVMRGRSTPSAAVEMKPGTQPALVELAVWEAIQDQFALRDKGAGSGRTPKGRPGSNHLLWQLARCGNCGSTMRGVTSSYRRKSDGGRARLYRCEHVHDKDGLCDALDVNADVVEPALLAQLARYSLDVQSLVADAVGERDSVRELLVRHVTSEREQVAELVRKAAIIGDKYADQLAADDDTMANASAHALERLSTQRAQAEHRLAELEDTLATQEAADPVNAVLDWWNELAAELRGIVKRGRLQDVNAGLRERLGSVTLSTLPDAQVLVHTAPKQPVSLSALASGEVEAPRELHAFVACGKEPYSQSWRRFLQGAALPVLTIPTNDTSRCAKRPAVKHSPASAAEVVKA